MGVQYVTGKVAGAGPVGEVMVSGNGSWTVVDLVPLSLVSPPPRPTTGAADKMGVPLLVVAASGAVVLEFVTPSLLTDVCMGGTTAVVPEDFEVVVLDLSAFDEEPELLEVADVSVPSFCPLLLLPVQKVVLPVNGAIAMAAATKTPVPYKILRAILSLSLRSTPARMVYIMS